MSDEWYDIAWINFTKALLHGQVCEGQPVEKWLTETQIELVYDLNERHKAEKDALLRKFAVQP
jgi:hypothetical protein